MSTFLLMSSWYFFNDCILYGLENYLIGKKNTYHDFTQMKVIKVFNRNYFIYHHVLNSTYFYSTVIVFFIALFKLFFICAKKCEK